MSRGSRRLHVVDWKTSAKPINADLSDLGTDEEAEEVDGEPSSDSDSVTLDESTAFSPRSLEEDVGVSEMQP